MDRPDDTTDFQVHFLYVIPSNGQDGGLDTSGKIASYADAAQKWFKERADGSVIRYDTFQGTLDVTFVKLNDTDSALNGELRRIRRGVEAAGFDRPNKLYAVYYAGTAPESLCGVTGGISVTYVPKASAPGCSGLDGSLVMLHEVIHAMGAVAPCAPHYDARDPAHVTDDRRDVMFSGRGRSSLTTYLDANHDDYYKHSIPGCLDIAKSPFLDPSQYRPFDYPGWPDLSLPSGVAVDGQGNVYVADTLGNRVQKFTASGRFLTSWGSEGSGDGQFRQPRGIASAPDGDVFVVDQLNHRVQRFSAEGAFRFAWGRQGNGHGEFDNPRGIAIDRVGNVYVVDYGNHRIQKFDRLGRFLAAIGAPGDAEGELAFPQGVALGPDGTLFVADTQNHRVEAFTSDGRFFKAWGGAGSADGQLNFPSGVAVDGAGNVYVADTFNARIQKLSPDGKFLQKWETPGPDRPRFDRPAGVAVDGSGTVYVAESGANRLSVITVPKP